MDSRGIKKLTMMVNSAIIIMVLALALFFYLTKAMFMVYFSIPTFFVYVFMYILISRGMYSGFLRIVYFWLTLYMGVATVCLGYSYGFHLYSMSMIPIIYYTNYMAYKLNLRKVGTGIYSGMIVIMYLLSTMHVSIYGPIYESNEFFSMIFWVVNSLIVFSFLVFYTKFTVDNMIKSEDKLKEMSYVDRLTGLYNRHYMMERLEEAYKTSEGSMIAMIDIDDFKKINDVYGHNAGDYVLEKVSKIMKENCDGTIISRWGGEEFLLLIKNADSGYEMMDKLLEKINSDKFVFDDKDIKVSVTIGVEKRDKGLSLHKWIQAADEKLYIGKTKGKNVVIK